MRYTKIPMTELNPSVICMGGGPLCAEDEQAHIFELLDTYYGLGGNFIDSANIYGKWLPAGINTCDRNIGAWLSSRGVRDEIVITSKAGHPLLDSMSVSRMSKSEVAADLDESLCALQCDVLDLYYLHRDDEAIPVSVIIDYLNDFVQMGKIRYFGASNWRIERLRQAQQYAKNTGQMGFSANQVMWSYPEYDLEQSDIPGLVWLDRQSMDFHTEINMAVVAYQSQARGFFNKIASQDGTSISEALWAQYGGEKNLQRYDRAVRLAKELEVSLTAISLAYLLNQQFTSFTIIGSHTQDQIRDSMSAADVRLTAEQLAFLEFSQ